MRLLNPSRPLLASLSAVGALAALLSVVGGCADIVGIEVTTLATSDECGTFAYQPGPEGTGDRDLGTAGTNFSCVGDTAPVSDGADITIKIPLAKFEDFVTPIEGLTVRGCNSSDTACANPVAEAVSGADGIARLELPSATVRGNTGFTGFVEINGTGTDGTEYVPYLLYFSEALVEGDNEEDGTTGEFPTFMVQPAELPQKFHQVVGADESVIAERGWIVMDARDCTLAGASDVRFSIDSPCSRLDEKSRESYFNEAGAVSPLINTSSTKAAVAPLGGFLNVLPDIDVVVRAYWRPDEQNLQVAQKTVAVRAGHLTTMRFEPNR